ncbi:MAG: hypothetical protein RL026_1351 [Pseudomonadota bacterium]|jgi:DNA polymerase-3 subunit beta
MKFSATREQILQPLQGVIGVVERKQTMPILANVLVRTEGTGAGRIHMTGTDLEVEMVASGEVAVAQAGEVTLPGRKFLDIVRAVPEGTLITISIEGDKAKVVAGRSRFTLATLPAAEFPVIDDVSAQQVLRVPQAELKRLIEKTHFSMAQQDVRYYLNGTLFETSGSLLRAVATDGHRLAVADATLAEPVEAPQQVIVPRKGVLELQRILGESGEVELVIGSNHIRATIGDVRFTSKLIDGKFPEYSRVIPSNPTRIVAADRQALRQALHRTSILSNEKYRGVRLSVSPGTVSVMAHNPEQEEAEDSVEVSYQGEPVEIGFNVTYLMDALAAVDGDTVEIGLTDANSSCLVRAPGLSLVRFVVMPMRL